LEVALDFGFTEQQFWEMTLGELERALNSKRRVEKARLQEKASFDYILADLIGRSIARMQSSANNMPEISEVYPTLFDSKEIQEKRAERQAELSALRFKLFAQSYNEKFKREEAQKVNE
jgi:hypothetical protein